MYFQYYLMMTSEEIERDVYIGTLSLPLLHIPEREREREWGIEGEREGEREREREREREIESKWVRLRKIERVKERERV